MTSSTLQRHVSRCAIFLATSLAALPLCAQQPEPDAIQLPVRRLQAGIHVIRAEVASTDDERELGLMYRRELAANDGMAFIFDFPARECMWMKNTLVPLSVAFMDDTGKIINIEDMQPQTTDSHCSAEPAVYALEMNLGWFAKHGIKPGTKITGLAPPRTR